MSNEHEAARRIDFSSAELSVVVPLYNEEVNIGELYRRLDSILRDDGIGYEIVLVNDGSTDRTHELLDGLHKQDPHVVVLHLSRNFGHQAAVSAGIDAAVGDAVVVMDGDLQDPPEVIPQFVRLWREGNDVVYAIRKKRKEGWLKRLGYFTFYRTLSAISELEIPLDSGDFCLMSRRVVRALADLPERKRFVRGLRTFVGFRQVGVAYERSARRAGRPKYTLGKLVRLGVDGLVSFSSYPLRLVTYLGLANAVLAVGLTVWVAVDALWNHTAPRGWASTMVVVLYIGSIQLICLGIIGEYIRLIFWESKHRPTYIVSEFKGRGHRSGRAASGCTSEGDAEEAARADDA
jgi:dolichol-phosphate mannosyltransferase